MNVTDRLRAWSYRRQLLDRSGTKPLETLRHVVGVYSTHPTAPLALLARSQSLTPAEFLTMEERREVVRVVGMRGSAFLVPTESAARIVAATRPRLQQLAGRLAYGGLDFESYERLTPLVLRCCATPASRSELIERAGNS